MDNFINKLNNHIEHVKRVGSHCSTEETTKQAKTKQAQSETLGDCVKILIFAS